ncbi:alpha/beta hydrolase [Sphingomonas parva]|nr:alpha/beta hydrolase [Sphingomonas parva]
MLRSETAQEPARAARALEGLRRYQEARRPPLPAPKPAIASLCGATLRAYGEPPGSGDDGAAVLFVPSLINPPNILDLGAETSLLNWLAARGHRPLLLDWGWDVETRRNLSVAGHVEQILLPLIETLESPPALVGYCLGGTMALAAAARGKVRNVATIAAPWHFAAYPAPARALLASLWTQGKPLAERLGAFPMEMLQSAFWSLDPARTIAKFERFATLDPASPEAHGFVLLEDWANDGPPIGEAAARELFESFFAEDRPGSGRWDVAGRPVDPAALSCPFLNIVSTTDRIVPAASVAACGERLEIPLGHVGMVVGARGRAQLWQPLSDWLFRT